MYGRGKLELHFNAVSYNRLAFMHITEVEKSAWINKLMGLYWNNVNRNTSPELTSFVRERVMEATSRDMTREAPSGEKSRHLISIRRR